MAKRAFAAIFSKENLLAVGVALLLVLIVVFAVDTSPTWIYQGF